MDKAVKGGNCNESYSVSTPARTISQLERDARKIDVDVEVVDTKFEGEGSGPIPSSAVSASASASSSASASACITVTDKVHVEEITELAAAMKVCEGMKIGELKKELVTYGICTKSFLEKSEFVEACASARINVDSTQNQKESTVESPSPASAAASSSKDLDATATPRTGADSSSSQSKSEATKAKEFKRELKQLRKQGRRYAKDGVLCQECGKNQTLENPFSVCAKCKRVHYCSRKCQKKHWPVHKVNCKMNCNAEAKIQQDLGSHGVQMNSLLETWKRKAQPIYAMAACSVMTKRQLQMQPPDFVVMVKVQFNYNSKTFEFLVDERPNVLEISTLPDHIRGNIETSMAVESKIGKLTNDKAQVCHYLLIHCADLVGATIKPLMMPLEQMIEYIGRGHNLASWGEDCRGLNITCADMAKAKPSRLFQSWGSLCTANMNSQSNYLTDNFPDDHASFVLNSFRLFSSKPRHMTHGIIIEFELGMGLGKIQKFKSYKVETLKNIEDMLNNGTLSPGLKKFYECKMDVKNSPDLIRTRISYPKNVMLVIIYIHRSTEGVMAFFKNSFSELLNVGGFSVKNNDRKAKASFEALRSKIRSLPDVSTPSFDGCN